jgi:predicted regulator of Ras-like GTPase activity (Roadblock/LC7/MglB family)
VYLLYRREVRGFVLYDSIEGFRPVLNEVFEQNSQVLMISLTTPEGLPVILLSREGSGIEEITDASVTNRYAALVGASTSLGDRTLSTLSQETVRLIHVQGESRDIAISIAEKVITLVITEPSGSANLLAEKLANNLKVHM